MFIGGPGYVHIFSDINPLNKTTGEHQLSEDRTSRLRDRDVTTCVPVFQSEEISYAHMRVLPGSDYLYKRTFYVDVISTSGFPCSPLGGFDVAVYHGDEIYHCVALKEAFEGGKTKCRSRCSAQAGMDFVLLEITRQDGRAMESMNICEIVLR